MMLLAAVCHPLEGTAASRHVAADPGSGYGNDDEVEELVNAAEIYFGNLDNHRALDNYLKVLERDPEHFQALWKTSLIYNIIGHQFDSRDKREEYYTRARDYAGKALEHHGDRAEAHYVYAAAVGRLADVSGARTRMRLAGEIRDHAEIAVDLDPEFARAWHLLGVWHFRAANLSFAERAAARVLGGLPQGASNEDAEQYLQRAAELSPDVVLFQLDLARFYKEHGQHEKAREILRYAVNLQPQIGGDEKHIEDSKKMLDELV